MQRFKQFVENRDKQQLRKMGLNPRSMTIGKAPQYDYDQEVRQAADVAKSHSSPSTFANYGERGERENAIAQKLAERRLSMTPKILMDLDAKVSNVEKSTGDTSGRSILKHLWDVFRSEYTDEWHSRQRDMSQGEVIGGHRSETDDDEWVTDRGRPNQRLANAVKDFDQAHQKFGKHKHVVTDQQNVFTAWNAMADWLEEHGQDTNQLRAFIRANIDPSKGGKYKLDPLSGEVHPWRN